MSIMQSDFVEVKLTRGLVTIIDVEDFEMARQHFGEFAKLNFPQTENEELIKRIEGQR